MAETYSQVSQLKHIQLRPDTYIGSAVEEDRELWLPADTIQHTEYTCKYNPGFYKLFDEIVVNVFDHYTRSKSVKSINIEITDTTITVHNDGPGIHVYKTKDGSIWSPTLIFGHFLTGSNFDDSKTRLTGGRNGFGAKLANVFSTEFKLETWDDTEKKYFTQIWRDNMAVVMDPVIAAKPPKGFTGTRVSFTPDLRRFYSKPADRAAIPETMRRVFHARTIQLAALLPDVKVCYNGERLKLRVGKSGNALAHTLDDYAALYYAGAETTSFRRLYVKTDRWEIVVGRSPTDSHLAVSFVNGIHTLRGGKHVDAVLGLVEPAILAAKPAYSAIKPAAIRNYLAVFVSAFIENPTFDGQAKEKLTLAPSRFGSAPQIPEKTLNGLFKTLGFDDVLAEIAGKALGKKAAKSDGSKSRSLWKEEGLEKLSDAQYAGSSRSADCTLILTEGDSAKGMAMNGLSAEQRKVFGVFPLKGKLKNVESVADAADNKEISAIKKILGLKTGSTYADVKTLRYGRVLVMTDQDFDGSHICGLVLRLFASQWPSLLKLGYVAKLPTPIIKAAKSSEIIPFYTMHSYAEWAKAADRRGWKIAYYKGLGSSTNAEAKTYFQPKPALTEFRWTGPESEKALSLAFDSTRANDRKAWLSDYDYTKTLTKHTGSLPIEEFVHLDLKHFSYYSLERAIPSAIDGLKVSQRKILYAALKKNLVEKQQVAKFAGYVSETAGYHHGEVSLQAAIVNMAQDFVGSNNLNLLMPEGNFGSRLLGGDDAASARYIYTKLNPLTRKIFRPEDDAVLEYCIDDDGDKIEPHYYAPVIPMVLVNGSAGIGTGFSSSIPMWTLETVLEHTLKVVEAEDSKGFDNWDPTPCYRKWTGRLEAIGSDSDAATVKSGASEHSERRAGKSWKSYGVATPSGKPDASGKYARYTITETPMTNQGIVSTSTLLETNLKKFVDEQPMDTSTADSVNIVVNLTEPLTPDEFMQKAGLVKKIAATNIHAFNANRLIEKFGSAADLFNEWFITRRELYDARRTHMLGELKTNAERHDNIIKFLQAQLDGKLDLRKKTVAEISALLEKLKIERSPEGNYEYLLRMPFRSITEDDIHKHREKAAAARAEYEKLNDSSIWDLWKADLTELQKAMS